MVQVTVRQIQLQVTQPTNQLNGGAGNDVLYGGSGVDTLIGGLSNDSYFVENVGDVVIELLKEGTDTVNSSVNCTLLANVENLTLTDTLAINGTGNSHERGGCIGPFFPLHSFWQIRPESIPDFLFLPLVVSQNHALITLDTIANAI